MHLIALLLGLAACAAIIAIGIRFILAPRVALDGFGLAIESPRALTQIKGIRDITSGIVPAVAWAAAGQTTLGWVLVAAALTPIGDGLIVVTNGGRRSAALGIHGVTAALLIATGLVLALS